MQHLAKNEITKRMFRQTICQNCNQRPPQSENLPPSIARSCEETCPIFMHIDALRQIAAPPDRGRTLALYDPEIRQRICNHLCLQPGHGDYCNKAMNVTCPLVRFMCEVIGELEELPEATSNTAPARE